MSMSSSLCCNYAIPVPTTCRQLTSTCCSITSILGKAVDSRAVVHLAPSTFSSRRQGCSHLVVRGGQEVIRRACKSTEAPQQTRRWLGTMRTRTSTNRRSAMCPTVLLQQQITTAPPSPTPTPSLALPRNRRDPSRRLAGLYYQHSQVQARWMTHYERLGLVPPSNEKEIKRAYFQKAKECHPDLHGTAKTKEFQELSAAYAVLSDPRKKASYDASGYQDRNYDAPSQPGSSAGFDDMPDVDAAYAMFRQVFNEFGFQMYYDTLVQDVQNSYDTAIAKQSYEPFWDLAKRRKGLVLGIVVPSLLVFRFPWIALAATRVLGSVGMMLFQMVARNPRLQAAVAAWLWKRIVEFSARMTEQAASSSSSSGGEQADKSKNGTGSTARQNVENGSKATSRNASSSSNRTRRNTR
ncbi:unnamed protein product [Amoebophrya sp. A120]|nr:unnamed protein product [Amoebophrya sp. A120]|eukprot:GSA120T00006669001.1